jgi:asparagine synthase (glutamine-hydrolysing)
MTNQYGRDRFASPADHYFALNSLIPSAAKPHLFQPWAWAAADEDRGMRAYYDQLFAERAGEPTCRKNAAVLHRVNLEGLLARLDSATMLAGLEARVPYTDHRLVERMFRVPQRFKIAVSEHEQAPYLASGELERRGSLQSKRMLRTLADRLMPRELARRKKASFPTPVASWMSGPWSERVRGMLLSSPFGRETFQPQAIRELADNVARAGMWLWPVLNVLAWGDRQFSQS